MEFDFYGKKLTQDILEYLFQELISNPLAYGNILDVLESLILVQTKDTFITIMVTVGAIVENCEVVCVEVLNGHAWLASALLLMYMLVHV